MISIDDIVSLDYAGVEKKIAGFLRDFFGKAGIKRAVLGVSGGVDSATTLYLLVRTLGPENVTALIMPDPEATPPEDLRDARRITKELGVEVWEAPIGNVVDAFKKSLPYYDEKHVVALGNLKARVRMCMLYYYANTRKAIVVGTGDRSEILIGYFTKYGDGGVDVLPIGNLYKSQVRRLALHLGVDKSIAFKPSSPRLWPGQSAEGELGLSYEEIDLILYAYFDRKIPLSEIPRETGIPENKVKAVLDRVKSTSHKRQLPPIAPIT